MAGSKVEWSAVEPHCALWGTIDDRVAIYPWHDAAPTRDVIDSQLLKAALQGEPLFIVDAHLWMSDAPRTALFDDESILRELLAAGFVRVVSKNDGQLSALAEQMAGQIPSFRDFVNSDAWQGCRRGLQHVEKSAEFKWCTTPDVDFGVGFIQLVEQLRNGPFVRTGLICLSEKEFHVFIERFLAMTRAEKKGPRSLWETCAKELPLQQTMDLMQLGNELYHMNFATCLAGAFSKPLRVHTRMSAIFDDLTTERDDGADEQAAEEIGRDEEWALGKIPEVNFEVPERWKPTGYEVRTILEAIKGPKETYRRSYESYVKLVRDRARAADPAVWRAEVRRKRDALETTRDVYQDKLLEQTRDVWRVTTAGGRRLFKRTVDWGIPLAGLGWSLATQNPVPLVLSIAFNVTSLLSKLPTTLERFRVRGNRKHPPGGSAGGSLPPSIASRRIHVDAARDHVATLPTFGR